MSNRTWIDDLRARYPGASTFTRQLNGPDLVNGQPVGPLVELRRHPELWSPRPEADPLLAIAAGWRR